MTERTDVVAHTLATPGHDPDRTRCRSARQAMSTDAASQASGAVAIASLSVLSDPPGTARCCRVAGSITVRPYLTHTGPNASAGTRLARLASAIARTNGCLARPAAMAPARLAAVAKARSRAR